MSKTTKATLSATTSTLSIVVTCNTNWVMMKNVVCYVCKNSNTALFHILFSLLHLLILYKLIKYILFYNSKIFWKRLKESSRLQVTSHICILKMLIHMKSIFCVAANKVKKIWDVIALICKNHLQPNKYVVSDMWHPLSQHHYMKLQFP